METLLITLGLVLLAVPVIAVLALIIAQQAGGRITVLENRLALAEAELRRLGALPGAAGQPASPEAPPETIPEAIPEPVAEEDESFAEPLVPEEQAAPPAPPEGATPVAGSAARARGFEEVLGARWAVWVGGLALGLGGIFLVRYSIAQGLLGPGVRIVLGALFALGLLAAGEFLRRSGASAAIVGFRAADAPSVITAAGAATAFGVAYAAYGLYGFVGPGLAFVMLGVIAVATMLAAVLHGPILAPLGLLGALAAPLLIGGGSDQLWPLVPYLLAVAGAACGVAEMRRWRWLTLAATTGALLWSPLLMAQTMPALAHIALQTALAAFFLVALPYRHARASRMKLDRQATLVLAAFTFMAILAITTLSPGSPLPWFSGVVALVLVATAALYPSAATAAPLAFVLVAATLFFWPVALESLDEPVTILPGPLSPGPVPDAFGRFVFFAVAMSALGAGASLWRLATSRFLRLPVMSVYSAAMASGPLLVLIVAWWRLTGAANLLQGERDLPFAVAAGLLGLVYVAAARMLMMRGHGAPGRLALGAAASAALASLALGLVFWLDRGMLTVAFALAALGTAYVADRTGIVALRWGVGATGLIILARLVYDPSIVGGDPGQTIVFNWLLWGYGIPAIAFFLASRVLERRGRDRVTRLAESLSIVFAALLVFFQIRHALRAGDPFGAISYHLEAGLLAAAGLCFSLVMVRIDARRPDVVTRWAGLVFGAITLLTAALGLGLLENPLLTNEPLLGGQVFNSLLAAYLLPAILAAFLAREARGSRPRFYVVGAGALAFGLHFLWTIMAIRAFWQWPRVGIWRGAGEAEFWAYSAALLVLGLVFLGIGLWRDRQVFRYVAGAYLVAAVIKVFLYDLANLEGVMRAVSFIVLGAVLVGIGLFYQKVLAPRRPVPGSGVG